MRFAGAEETGDPDPDQTDDVDLAGALDGVEIGAEEGAEMDVEFPGDDVLVQLLPHRGGVVLVGLDDAIDGAVDRLGEEILDQHAAVPEVTSRKAR